jgi:N-acetyl-anhydromuramyl-L-alanine amidase AmpD
MINGDETLQWLRGVGVDLPDGLTASSCRALASRPDESVYRRIGPIELLVVHHSGTPTGSATAFRVLHRGVFGWDDIGYHYVVGNGTMTADGMVEEGRPEWALGAHSRGNNERSMGVCLVGDLNAARPTARQMKSLGELLGDILNRYDLDRNAVRLHRQMPGNSTECPGRHLPLKEVLGVLRQGP